VPALAGAGPAAGASEGPPADFDPAGARTLLLPLRVRDRTVGVLVLLDAAGITFDAARRRLLEALAYYAALAAERVRLAAEAEHADALRQADRLKDALLASVSHDLRTPLTTIKALAHDIGVSGDERAVVIEEEADRLNRFVADLLDLSRLAGGALTVAPEFNTADDLVGAVLQRVAGATEGRVIDVALDASEPLLVGRFDFSHALRILANLLENAVKYSPDDGPVDLVVTRARASPARPAGSRCRSLTAARACRRRSGSGSSRPSTARPAARRTRGAQDSACPSRGSSRRPRAARCTASRGRAAGAASSSACQAPTSRTSPTSPIA
jgi:hypothetical protein